MGRERRLNAFEYLLLSNDYSTRDGLRDCWSRFIRSLCVRGSELKIQCGRGRERQFPCALGIIRMKRELRLYSQTLEALPGSQAAALLGAGGHCCEKEPDAIAGFSNSCIRAWR